MGIGITLQLSTFGEGRVNVALQKKIADGSEAIIILEGVVGFLDQPISVLVRLQSALSLNDLPEVDIGTRFLFLFAGPPIRNASLDDESGPSQFADIGISLATAFTDKEFVTEVIFNVQGLLIFEIDIICNKIVNSYQNKKFKMYKAQSKECILDALDSYTHGIKCLPREWDAEHKIDPPPVPTKKLGDELEEIDEDRR